MMRFIDPDIKETDKKEVLEKHQFHIIGFETDGDFITYYVNRNITPPYIRGNLMLNLHSRHDPLYFHGSDGEDRPGFKFPQYHNHVEYDHSPTLEDYEKLWNKLEYYDALTNEKLKTKIRGYYGNINGN